MKFRAKSKGFFAGRLVQPGEELDVQAKHEIGVWMEPLDAKAKAAFAEYASEVKARQERSRQSAFVPVDVRVYQLQERVARLEDMLGELIEPDNGNSP